MSQNLKRCRKRRTAAVLKDARGRVISAVSLLLVAALILSCSLFAVVWAICVRIENYGYLDVIWSLSVAILAPIYALLGPGDPERRVAFATIGAIWSLRLGVYILIRVTRHHPHEDARYRTLGEMAGPGEISAVL
jgi:steroid 5-alpha reductase family enzyme